MTREEIDLKYLNQANQLEAEFFKIVNKGKPSQHRVLKSGRTTDQFNQRHGDIWKAHQTELISQGFIEKPDIPPEEPPRDLEQEIDQITAALKQHGIL